MPLMGIFVLPQTRPRLGGAFLSRSQENAPPAGRGSFLQKNSALSLGGATSKYSNPRSPVGFQES